MTEKWLTSIERLFSFGLWGQSDSYSVAGYTGSLPWSIVDHCTPGWCPSVDFLSLLFITGLYLTEQLRSCGDGVILLVAEATRATGLLDLPNDSTNPGAPQEAPAEGLRQRVWQHYRNGPQPGDRHGSSHHR